MATSDRPASAGRYTAGRVLIWLGSLVLIGSASAKLDGVPQVASELRAFGFLGGKVTLIGIVEIVSALLFLVPRTRSAGLLLVSAFLGGAVATHVQHGEAGVQPAIVLALLWLGAWLRHPQALWSPGPTPEVLP